MLSLSKLRHLKLFIVQGIIRMSVRHINKRLFMPYQTYGQSLGF